MPYAVANGLQQYYEEEGSGPPLVLLNGGFGTVDATINSHWALRPFLAQRFHIVHVEARAHGRTDNPDEPDSYTLPTLAADIAALIEQLGLAPAHVAGFSLGGIVGLELALAHPRMVRSVVGLGTNYTPDAKTRAGLQRFDPDRLEREEPAWAAEYARRHDPHHGLGHWRDLLGWVRAVAAAPRSYTAEDLGRITVPTLWIAGENDFAFELDQLLTMKRRIPGAEILIVNHADHPVQITHPHLVGPAIVDFLARSDEGRRRSRENGDAQDETRLSRTSERRPGPARTRLLAAQVVGDEVLLDTLASERTCENAPGITTHIEEDFHEAATS
jgi:pimeloyl-ACP methyl ester carboxylesterase